MNTQLLAQILEKAAGKQLSKYLEEKIWQPLGMEGATSYMASGLRGQIIYVASEKQLLIIRFGHHKKEYSINFWKDIMQQMADRL